MLVPADHPCSACGHPRRDHDLVMEVAAERCARCGCTIEVIPVIGTWNPEAPPRAFDWRFALLTFVMSIDAGEPLYTAAIHRWRPGYDLKEGELEELRSVELLVRELWLRYAPVKPKPFGDRTRSVAEENAEVDDYERKKRELGGVLLRLTVTDEWRTFFPPAEHDAIERARRVIIARGGPTEMDRSS